MGKETQSSERERKGGTERSIIRNRMNGTRNRERRRRKGREAARELNGERETEFRGGRK